MNKLYLILLGALCFNAVVISCDKGEEETCPDGGYWDSERGEDGQ